MQQHGIVPSQFVGRLPWKIGECCCLQHCPPAHRWNQKAAALVTFRHVSPTPAKGRKRRKEKSPPHECLLLQLPRQNSQEKDTSPEVSERATENPVQEKPGESSGAAGAAVLQAAALDVPQGSPSPSKYCSQRASQLRTNMLLLHVFLLFMCSEELSFLLVFLWLAGTLVLDAERHVIDTLGEKLQAEWTLHSGTLGTKDFSAYTRTAIGSWTACMAHRDYSLTALMLYQCHLESTLLVAATALSNHHVSSFIGSYRKTLPCHFVVSTI